MAARVVRAVQTRFPKDSLRKTYKNGVKKIINERTALRVARPSPVTQIAIERGKTIYIGKRYRIKIYKGF